MKPLWLCFLVLCSLLEIHSNPVQSSETLKGKAALIDAPSSITKLESADDDTAKISDAPAITTRKALVKKTNETTKSPTVTKKVSNVTTDNNKKISSVPTDTTKVPIKPLSSNTTGNSFGNKKSRIPLRKNRKRLRLRKKLSSTPIATSSTTKSTSTSTGGKAVVPVDDNDYDEPRSSSDDDFEEMSDYYNLNSENDDELLLPSNDNNNGTGDELNLGPNITNMAYYVEERNIYDITTEKVAFMWWFKWIIIGAIVLVPLMLLPLLFLFTRSGGGNTNDGDHGEQVAEDAKSGTPVGSGGGGVGLVGSGICSDGETLRNLPESLIMIPTVQKLDHYLQQFKDTNNNLIRQNSEVNNDEPYYFLSKDSTIECIPTGQIYHAQSGLIFIPINDLRYDPEKCCNVEISNQDKSTTTEHSPGANQVYNPENGALYERCLSFAFEPNNGQFYLPKSPISPMVIVSKASQISHPSFVQIRRVRLEEVPKELKELYQTLLSNEDNSRNVTNKSGKSASIHDEDSQIKPVFGVSTLDSLDSATEHPQQKSNASGSARAAETGTTAAAAITTTTPDNLLKKPSTPGPDNRPETEIESTKCSTITNNINSILKSNNPDNEETSTMILLSKQGSEEPVYPTPKTMRSGSVQQMLIPSGTESDRREAGPSPPTIMEHQSQQGTNRQTRPQIQQQWLNRVPVDKPIPEPPPSTLPPTRPGPSPGPIQTHPLLLDRVDFSKPLVSDQALTPRSEIIPIDRSYILYPPPPLQQPKQQQRQPPQPESRPESQLLSQSTDTSQPNTRQPVNANDNNRLSPDNNSYYVDAN